MITGATIAGALRSVWLLFLDKPGAVQSFDASLKGFWESFQAILLVAPIYAFIVVADLEVFEAAAGVPLDANRFFLARGLTLVLDWVTFPILLAALAGFLGVRHGYALLIVIRNWGTVFTLIPYAAVSLLEMAGVVRGQQILFPAAIAVAIALRVSYLAARRALGVPVDVAVGFVAFDFLLSLAIASTVAYLLGVPG